MRARLALAFLSLLVAVPAASAGTADDPDVTDPAGDVLAFGAPVPAALDWGDVRSAWFAADNGTITLSIQVGAGQEAPPQGEVGVTFRVGAQHWIAGYTVVPGLYSGGFLSKSDAGGDVSASESPETMPATWADGLIEVRFPVATLDANGTAGFLEVPWGWSESRATNGETYRLDATAPGRSFAWQEPEVPPPTSQPTQAPATQAAPGGLLAVAALAAAVGLRRRRLA